MDEIIVEGEEPCPCRCHLLGERRCWIMRTSAQIAMEDLLVEAEEIIRLRAFGTSA